MTPLRTIARDLVERRLWPLAALLVVGLIAIPVLFLRPAPAALETSADAAATAPAAAPAAAAPAAGAAAAPTSTDAAADPSVALTSSPFAAAFGGGLNLPPAMEGLLKATKGKDARKDVADAPLRDPFSINGGAAPAASAAVTAEPGTAPALTPSAPAVAGGTAAPASPSPATAPIPSPEPLPQPAPAPKTPVADAPADDEPVDPQGTTYHADVQFGTVETSPMVEDAQRLTAFPSSFAPVAVYLGVMRGGWGAVFAIRDDARPVGSSTCRPRKQICSWVILHPGESVTLNTKDETTGAITPYTLTLAKIRRTVLDADAALEANRKADAAGRCLLGPLAAYRYDTQTGTLALRDEMKDCQYRTPDQPENAAVRTYRIG